MREFDIFVPLYFNNGGAIPQSLFQELQKRLLARFDGLTFFPQPNKGYWKMGAVTFLDEIVIYRAISDKRAPARRFLAKLKKWMKDAFQQEDILIIQRKIDVIP